MTLDHFLDRLRAYESGIDPNKDEWYRSNLHKEIVLYPRVDSDGVVLRDILSGRHEIRSISVLDYFTALGVAELYLSGGSTNLRKMQYRSTNAWGFIGYQVGEHVLLENGYYIPSNRQVLLDGEVLNCLMYHRGVDDLLMWSEGIRERVMRYEEEEERVVVVTDVNRWNGRFTGKGGIHCLEDLYDPAKQEALIKVIIENNLRKVLERGASEGCDVARWLDLSWRIPDENAQNRLVNCSLSGIAAACHLSGHLATLRLLCGGTGSSDELGTGTLSYMSMFANYDIDPLVPLEWRELLDDC